MKYTKNKCDNNRILNIPFSINMCWCKKDSKTE